MATLIGIKRVSREGGRKAKGDGFHSPTEQVDVCEAWAAANGHTIAYWVDESDSVSGKTIEREGVQAALEAVHAGKADGVIVMKVDRLCRDMVGGLLAVRELENAGKMFVAVKDGITGDGSEMSQLLLTVLLWMAEWYLKGVTKGWVDVRRRHISNGVPTNAPYGWAKHHEPGCQGKQCGCSRTLVPEPDEAPWVLKMFQKRAAGLSWERLADWCNAQAECNPRQGEGWSMSSVRQIVTSRVHLGEITSGEFVNTSAHDPLPGLTADLWGQANRTYKTPKLRAPEQFMLSGLVRCAGCGVRMAGRSDIKGGQTYRYYRCRARHSFGRCTEPARVNADEIERAVEARFVARFLTGTAQPTESSDELDAALAEQAAADEALSAYLTSPAVENLRVTRGQGWFDEGLNARSARLAEAEQRVTEARNDSLGVALPTNLAELWPTLDIEEKRGWLAEGVDVIAVARGSAVQLWTRGDPSTPTGLPGRGISRMVPIAMPASLNLAAWPALDALAAWPVDVPAGAGMAPS